MKARIEVTEETRLSEILDAYPWLPEALAGIDARAKKIGNPLVRAVIRRANVREAAERLGMPAQELIARLGEIVAARETPG